MFDRFQNYELAELVGNSHRALWEDLPIITGRAENILPEPIEKALKSEMGDDIKRKIYLEFFRRTMEGLRIDELAAFLDENGQIVVSSDMLSKILGRVIH